MHSIQLLTCLLLSPARAAELPEVAVVGLHIPGQDAEAAAADAQRLAEALAATGKVSVVEPSELSTRLQGREALVIRDAALNRGIQALSDGRALFERADTEGAIPLLTRAVERLEEGTLLVGDPRELVEAHLLLGLAHASQGDNASALESWHTVAVLEPDHQLDPNRYAPKVVTLFEEARSMVFEEQAGALTVQAASGEVSVDGRPVGPAPATISGLPAGIHYVTLDTGDGIPAVASVELSISSDQTVTLSAEGAGVWGSAENPTARAGQIGELYKALGEYGETSLFVVGGVTGEGSVSLSLYSPRAESFSKALTADAGGDPAGALLDLVPSLVGYISETGALRTDRIAPQVPSLDIDANPLLSALIFNPAPRQQAPAVVETLPAEETGGGSRWLLWAGAGLVAAGGATVGVLAATGAFEGEPTVVDEGTITLVLE